MSTEAKKCEDEHRSQKRRNAGNHIKEVGQFTVLQIAYSAKYVRRTLNSPLLAIRTGARLNDTTETLDAEITRANRRDLAISVSCDAHGMGKQKRYGNYERCGRATLCDAEL